MNFWNAVVIIVAIVAFANIQMAKHRSRSSQGEPRDPARLVATDGRSTAALANEIEDLRERKD